MHVHVVGVVEVGTDQCLGVDVITRLMGVFPEIGVHFRLAQTSPLHELCVLC